MDTEMWLPGWAGVAAAIHMRAATSLMTAAGVSRVACLMVDRDKIDKLTDWALELHPLAGRSDLRPETP